MTWMIHTILFLIWLKQSKTYSSTISFSLKVEQIMKFSTTTIWQEISKFQHNSKHDRFVRITRTISQVSKLTFLLSTITSLTSNVPLELKTAGENSLLLILLDLMENTLSGIDKWTYRL